MHSKIITAAARQILKPMGLRQKGRSRFWYDDRGRYAIAVEFQPSARSRGTYLNVGVNWLWYPKDYWSFDLGDRKHDFMEFRNESRFQKAARAIAEAAVSEVVEIRTGLLSPSEACAWVRQRSRLNDGWPRLHSGILAALDGAVGEARGLIDGAFDPNPASDWVRERNAYIEDLRRKIGDLGALRDWIEARITECRALLRLSASPVPRLPPR